MTLEEIRGEWVRRRAEALEAGTTAPVAKLADVFLKQLKTLADPIRTVASRGQNGTAPDRLLTAANVAERLDVSRRYVYANAHNWPFTRYLGRAVRFSAEGLNAWLARSAE